MKLLDGVRETDHTNLTYINRTQVFCYLTLNWCQYGISRTERQSAKRCNDWASLDEVSSTLNTILTLNNDIKAEVDRI